MTSAYSSMVDPAVVSSLQGQYDMHSATGRSMMLHSPPPHFPQQQQPAPTAASHRQSPSTPLNAAGAYPGHQLAAGGGYGGPGPGGSGAPGYMVASTPGVSPGAAATPTTDAPAKRDRDSIYGFVRLNPLMHTKLPKR